MTLDKKFTKFSVWSEGIEELIEELAKECAVEKESIANFFYTKGLMVLHEVQMDRLRQYRNPYNKEQLQSVIISPEFVIVAKEMGFYTLRELLLQQPFVTLQNIGKIAFIYDAFHRKSMDRSHLYCGVQSAMLTQHHFLLSEGASIKDLFDFSVNFMEKSKLNQADDQITTMFEYADYEIQRVKAKKKIVNDALSELFPFKL